ncbi:MAG: GTPase [Candidatus Woesearchaeota archaeon]|jgi:nucleolar GTP-binding protein
MNFQTLPPVENAKQLLNLAFKIAREKSEQKSMRGQKDMGRAIKQKESQKLDIIKDVLNSRLSKFQRDFPEVDILPPFYSELCRLTLDMGNFKKSFGALKWAMDKIAFFQRQYNSKINRELDRYKISTISKEFYGRISSVMKQIDENLKYLESCRRIMKTYPDVKDMFTVCLYGFPNVGKTTLLNKLTGTRAEVADYSFTTKTINAGYLKSGEDKVQVLDVPGTLARIEKLNLIELQAELVVKELANLIIFIFDASEHGGYTIEKQEELLKHLGKDKKVLIYLSKVDLAEPELLSQIKHKGYSLEEIKAEINREMLKYKAKKEAEV